MTEKTIWSPRRIYLYLVCLITLVMMIVAAVNLARAVLELVYPGRPFYSAPVPVPAETPAAPEAYEKELRQQREAEERWARHAAVISLVGNATMLFVAAPLYRYHWRRIETGPAEGSAA